MEEEGGAGREHRKLVGLLRRGICLVGCGGLRFSSACSAECEGKPFLFHSKKDILSTPHARIHIHTQRMDATRSLGENEIKEMEGITRISVKHASDAFTVVSNDC